MTAALDVSAWHAMARRALKGADPETLTWRAADGFDLAPLHAAADGAPVLLSPGPKSWIVSQRVDHPDAAQANALLLRDLEGGATGLTIVGRHAVGACGYGAVPTADYLAEALDAVVLDAVTVTLDLGPHGRDAAHALASQVEMQRLDPARVDIRFGLDPLGVLASNGRLPAPWPEMAAPLARDIGTLRQKGFAGPFLAADGRVIHAAGGTEGQELGFMLACGLAYTRALVDAGWRLDEALAAIELRLASDADALLSLAKMRAVRLLWARLAEACGATPTPACLHAETAWRMMARDDPWTNLIRTTLATMAAGLGGADGITVLPFTAAVGLPDAFARRLARNASLILLEEAHLAKVGDPAAGSGVFEAVTEALCEAGWTAFGRIESAGGAFAALESGVIQAAVREAAAARHEALGASRETLVGVTLHRDDTAAAVAVLDGTPNPTDPPDPNDIRVDALRPLRLAEPFEIALSKPGAAT